MSLKQQKQKLTLPKEVVDTFSTITDKRVRNGYVKSLRSIGWTLESISEVLGMSREAIRQIITRGADENRATGLPLPNPPMIEVVVREKKVYPEPKPERLARMLELQPLAQQVRSHSAEYRQEAEEYTLLLHKAHTEDGVSIYRLAKRLGVTHGAIRFRLARYGYKPSPKGSSKVYDAILDKNRVNL